MFNVREVSMEEETLNYKAVLDEIDKEFDLAEDYDDHAWDEEELAEEEE